MSGAHQTAVMIMASLLAGTLACSEPRATRDGQPAPGGTATGGASSAVGGGAGASAPAGSGGQSQPGAGGSGASPPNTPASDADEPPAVPACGVKDGICLQGCPPSAADPDCSAAGPPKLDKGMSCTMGSDCVSGACTDGVCCESACSLCQSCAVTGKAGSCTALYNEPDPGQCAAAGQLCVAAETCGRLDQRSQGEVFNTALYPAGGALAQEIIVGRTGKLVAAKLRIDCRPSAVVTLEIRTIGNGTPGTVVLASESVTQEQVALQKPGERMITFSQPASVTAGQRIALAARFMTAGCTFQDHEGQAYPGTFWFLTPDGWEVEEEGDLSFQTYLVP